MILDLEPNPHIKVSGTFKDYYNLLDKKFQYLHKLLQDVKLKTIAMTYGIGVSFNLKWSLSLFFSSLTM